MRSIRAKNPGKKKPNKGWAIKTYLGNTHKLKHTLYKTGRMWKGSPQRKKNENFRNKYTPELHIFHDRR